jgi:hypothetical protein
VEETPRPAPDPADRKPPLLSETTKIVGLIGVFALIATGILAWGQSRETTQIAEAPAQTQPSAKPTARERGTTIQDAPKPTPSATTGPEILLDWIDYSPPSCDEPRAIGVNVIERRGDIEQVEVVVRAKEFDVESSRRLSKSGKEWTSYIRHIPSDTAVQLVAIAKGPGGETSLAVDVSRYC